jgi:antitoxin component of RelBE/YafQ-DinJ toxin-antitoxin module
MTKIMARKKDARMEIRLEKEEKEKFYKICDENGLVPSRVVNIWIKRFNAKSRKRVVYDEVYHASIERMVEYEKYRQAKAKSK